MAIATVGPEGEIVLPESIRDALSVEEGDQIAFLFLDGDVIIRPLNQTISDHFGSIDGPVVEDLEAVRQKIRKGKAEKRHPVKPSSATQPSS